MLRGVLACDTGSEVETGVWSGRVMAVVAAVAANSSHAHTAQAETEEETHTW